MDMFKDDRKIFWLAFKAENARRKIVSKKLASDIGFAPATVYKFIKKCAGSDELLEAISQKIFLRSYIEVVAEQDAELNREQKAEDKKGEKEMSIGDLYERMGEIKNEMRNQFEALNKRLDADIKETSANPHGSGSGKNKNFLR